MRTYIKKYAARTECCKKTLMFSKKTLMFFLNLKVFY